MYPAGGKELTNQYCTKPRSNDLHNLLFSVSLLLVTLFYSCTAGEHYTESIAPNIYARIFRESSDLTHVYAKDIRLTESGAYDPNVDTGIYDATVLFDNILCTNAISPEYQYYSNIQIPTSPGQYHTLHITIDNVDYLGTIKAPGNLVTSCASNYKKTDNIIINYSFSNNLNSNIIRAIVYSSDSENKENNYFEIIPSAAGTITIPAGTLSKGIDRYIEVVASNKESIPNASEESYIMLSQVNSIYLNIIE
jgi:hypothetical protein